MFGVVPFRRQTKPSLFAADLLKDFLDTEFNDSTIKTDIYEKDGKYVIEAELPGFERDEIKVDFEDDRLTISAQRNEVKEESSQGFIRKERSMSQVSRSFMVQDVDPEKIDAKYENGLLRLTVPKPENHQAKAKTIDIQ